MRALDPRVARTRRQVLDATTAVLAEEGFERLTIDALAARSGVARSTIYRHWPNPAELLVEAFHGLCGTTAVVDTGDLFADLLSTSRDLRAMLTSSPLGAALPSLIGAAAHDPILHEAARRFTRDRRAAMRARLAAGQDRGEVAHDLLLDLAVVRFVAPIFYTALVARDPLTDELLVANVRAALTELRPVEHRDDSPASTPG